MNFKTTAKLLSVSTLLIEDAICGQEKIYIYPKPRRKNTLGRMPFALILIFFSTTLLLSFFSEEDQDKKKIVSTPSPNLGKPIVYTPEQIAELKDFDVYLCIGQSNMVGRADIEQQDCFAIPNTLLFNGTRWETAQINYADMTQGLNRYNNQGDAAANCKLNPALYFANTMQANSPGRTIGIVSDARGDTALSQWVPGTALYNNALAMIQAGLAQGGKLRGIIWHQGESDIYTTFNLDYYIPTLITMVEKLRSDLNVGSEECPFIAGEIVYDHTYTVSGVTKDGKYFNSYLPSFVSKTYNTDYISAAIDPEHSENGGLQGRQGDPAHFNSTSLRILGVRYAEKMLNMQEYNVIVAKPVTGISFNETSITLAVDHTKENTPDAPQKPLAAKHYYSGFQDAHDTYNAISAASDGKIYYVLSSTRHDVGGQFYVYDPATDQTKFIADLSEALGEKEKKYIAQGKSHVEFYEHDGKLYFATHIGYYEMIDGSEQLPKNAPAGYKLYPGGHFVSYDMKSGKLESLALVPHGEGILTMTMDKQRGHLYGITWPKGYLLDYDMKSGKLKDLGLVNEMGEGGIIGKDYRVICRSMFVDPRDGNVYYSTAEGDIFYYHPDFSAPKKMDGIDLKIDYFGCYDYTGAGSMAYNWRKMFWYEPENVAYGVHGNSGYLFRFDPKAQKIEIVDRIVSEPSRKSGMYDLFSYGYLGYMLGKDQTIYYLTGGPIYKDGKRVKGVDKIAMGAARGLENLHLVTFNIPEKKYTDHGPIFYGDGNIPTYVNSIAMDPQGNVYTLARFMHDGKEIEDLVKIPLH